jgi:SprT protein
MAEELGSVGELARAWRLKSRLGRAAIYGRALERCLTGSVEVSERSKTIAGTAFTEDRRIVLNAQLFRVGREADRNATFLHECAHIIANCHKRRDCGHGAIWREVMATIGEPADRCHNIRYLSPKAHAIVTWQCRGCGLEYHFVRRPRRRPENCWCAHCGPRQGRLALHWEAAALDRPARKPAPRRRSAASRAKAATPPARRKR